MEEQPMEESRCGNSQAGAVVAASKQESSGLGFVFAPTPLITIPSSQQRAVPLTQVDL